MAYIFAITYRKTAETMNSMNERGRKTYFRSNEYYLVKVMNWIVILFVRLYSKYQTVMKVCSDG